MQNVQKKTLETLIKQNINNLNNLRVSVRWNEASRQAHFTDTQGNQLGEIFTCLAFLRLFRNFQRDESKQINGTLVWLPDE